MEFFLMMEFPLGWAQMLGTQKSLKKNVFTGVFAKVDIYESPK